MHHQKQGLIQGTTKQGKCCARSRYRRPVGPCVHTQKQSLAHKERHRLPAHCLSQLGTTTHDTEWAAPLRVAGLRLQELQHLHMSPQHPVFQPITFTVCSGHILFRTALLSFAPVPSPFQWGCDPKSCSNTSSLLKRQGLKHS